MENIFDVGITITLCDEYSTICHLTQYVLHKIQISNCQNWLARDRRICAIILVATKLLVLLLDYFMNTALIVLSPILYPNSEVAGSYKDSISCCDNML